MGKEQPQHAGSVTSPPKPPAAKSESEITEPEEKKGPAKKATRVIGQYEFMGQDNLRLLFQDRESKKCFTVDKKMLVYRGEGGFRVEVLETLQK